jgi:hypothetical protein
MLRFVAAAVAAIVISGFSGGVASAKQCRDAHGKFTKCSAMASPAPKRCRDSAGKFVKCSSMKAMKKM